MADPPATTLQPADAGGPDGLLATKLYLPRLQPGFLARPRLTDGLDEGLARGLVLVCAPAGFGKTALLADWARQCRRPVAWLSLDRGDNDPARFWRHVIAALDQMRPGTAEQLAPLLGPPPPPAFEGLVTALINELAAEPGAGEMLLVLDDYHLIDARRCTPRSDSCWSTGRGPAAGAGQPGRPAAGAGAAAGGAGSWPSCAPPSCASRRGGGGAAARGGRARPARGRRGGVDGAHRGVGGRAAAGEPVASAALRSWPGSWRPSRGSHRYVLDYLTEEVLEHQPRGPQRSCWRRRSWSG